MSIFTVSPKDIEDWSGRFDAPALFPLLIKKLLCATSKTLTYMDVRYMECNNQPGFDAVVVDSEGCRNWVPEGRSCWEFGDVQKTTTKANEDYNKRSEDSLGEDKSTITFVFATPKIWPTRAEWEKEKNHEGLWKKVVAIDAMVLANWIDECPSVKFWFMELSGKRRTDIESLDSCWEEWQNFSDPALPTFLFENELRKGLRLFNSWIDGKHSSVFTIVSESPLEGLAFVYQLAQTDTITQKGKNYVYVKSVEAFRTIAELYPSVDVVCVVTDTLIASRICLGRNNLRILQIVPSGLFFANEDDDYKSTYRMSLIDRACVNRLCKDYPDRHWEELVREAGYSRTVLRRRIAKNKKAVPRWAEEIQYVKLLMALALIGPWAETSKGGCELLFSLSGKNSDDCIETLLSIARIPDSPIWALDGTYGLVSPIECLEIISRFIKKNDLEIFLHHVRRWLIASSEQASMPEKQSLCCSLYMLFTRAHLLFPAYAQWFISEVEALGKGVLQHIYEEKREDLLFLLCLIGEIMPNTYLTFLSEIEVETNHNFFCKVYRGDSYGGIEKTLCMLAIPAQYFSQVVDIMCLWYRRTDAEIRREIAERFSDFLDADLPQTNADYITRKAAFDKVTGIDGKLAWDLCVAILKRKHSIVLWDRVKWRGSNWKLSNRAPIYDWQANEICIAAYDKLMGVRRWGYQEIHDMLDCVSVLGIELQDKLFTRLLKEQYELKNHESLELQDQIRDYVFQQGRRKNGNREFSHLALCVTKKIAPDDIVLNYAWIFRFKYWHRFFNQKDYYAAEEHKHKIRLWAFSRLWRRRGIDILKILTIDNVDVLDFSKCIVECLSLDEAITLLGWLYKRADIAGDIKSICARCIMLNLDDDSVRTAISRLHTLLLHDDFLLLLKALPSHNAVRAEVVERGIIDENAYWKLVYIGGSWLAYSPDVEYQTRSLLVNGRVIEAVQSLELCMDDVPKEILHDICVQVVNKYKQEGKMESNTRHAMVKCLTRLASLGVFSQSGLAKIELTLYLELQHTKYDCAALRKQVIDHPVYLAMLMELALGRGVLVDKRIFGARAKTLGEASWRFVRDGCSFSPRNEAKSILLPKLLDWIYALYTLAQRRQLVSAFMSFIGGILAQYGLRQHDWPVKEICEAVEVYFCDALASGFHVAIYNSRGVFCRPADLGGMQEGELFRGYNEVATDLEHEYPHIASIIAGTAETYAIEARRCDKEECLSKRVYA